MKRTRQIRWGGLAVVMVLAASGVVVAEPKSDPADTIRRVRPQWRGAIPIAWWSFDDAANLGADLTGNHHGQVRNAVAMEGRISGAAGFQGRATIEVPYSEALDLSTFTIAAWVYLDEDPSDHGVLSTRYPDEFTFDLKIERDRVHGDIGNGTKWLDTNLDIGAANVGATTQGGRLKPRTWHHVAYTVQADRGEVWMYLDGDVKRGVSLAGKPRLMKPGQKLVIGQSLPSEPMRGRIDEVQIWNTALSTNDVDLASRPWDERAGLARTTHVVLEDAGSLPQLTEGAGDPRGMKNGQKDSSQATSGSVATQPYDWTWIKRAALILVAVAILGWSAAVLVTARRNKAVYGDAAAMAMPPSKVFQFGAIPLGVGLLVLAGFRVKIIIDLFQGQSGPRPSVPERFGSDVTINTAILLLFIALGVWFLKKALRGNEHSE
jgi:hypothetical protein